MPRWMADACNFMVQMAEMYADLMELNDRLHRNLADKDGTICLLVHQLRDASIEVENVGM